MDYEAMLNEFYVALLRPGDVAIDIGAHVGRHAIPMARAVAPGGRVFAVEPLESCCRQMDKSIRLEHRDLLPAIQIDQLAFGNFVGHATFRHAVDAPAYSGLQPRVYDTPTEVRTIDVEVTTVDRHFLALNRLRYVKIDAEGGELHILQGAVETLCRHRPVVTFEFGLNSIESYGITCADMGEFWRAADYAVYDILGRELATVEDFVVSSTRQEVWDYVALPREREDSTRIAALLGREKSNF